MQEPKDKNWFLRKLKEEQEQNKQFPSVRKWQVAPQTFEETQAPPKRELRESKISKRSITVDSNMPKSQIGHID